MHLDACVVCVPGCAIVLTQDGHDGRTQLQVLVDSTLLYCCMKSRKAEPQPACLLCRP